MKKIKKIDIALLLGLIIAVIISSITAFARDLDEISDSVLRLHILANSDSEQDQALKLKVRDAILAETGELFIEANSRLEVEQISVDNIEKIEAIAKKTIADNGYDYTVECQLVNMEFDERIYENITLPAGIYDALRITIGEAKGKNWWCVMYPQFCIAPSFQASIFDGNNQNIENEVSKVKKDVTSMFLSEDIINASQPLMLTKEIIEDEESDEEKLSSLDTSQVKILEQPQKYKIKFKTLEWVKKFSSWF